MSRDWEITFRAWSKPSSETESERYENAERMIRAAITESPALTYRDVEVFAQGSYKNNTNVRLESDVDICVLCSPPFFTDFSLANGFSREDVGLVDSTFSYAQFKNEVGEALYAKFGSQSVRRGNKAFEIHENNYRINADVVPCFEHRRYTTRSYRGFEYLSGTEFQPDSDSRVVNWPKQHYENGVTKNQATGNRFKYLVRTLKCLRNEMAENGIQAARPISSFLIECLVWNVPNSGFGHDSYWADVGYVLAHTFNATLSESNCHEWGEVNELKYLFRASQPWTREQAHDFLNAAWNYIGFE